jgi:anti-sigma regulatory factor (Ser/Thr protein kinase)
MPLLVLDGTLRPLWVNEAFVADIGYTLDQLRRRDRPLPQDPYVRLSDPDALAAAVSAAQATSQPIALRDPRGHWNGAFLTATPLPGEHGAELWTLTLQDLAVASGHDLQARTLLAAERRNLQVIAEVSELAVNLDSGTSLTPIAEVLTRSLVLRAEFVIDPRARSRTMPDTAARHLPGSVLDEPLLNPLATGRDVSVELDLTGTYPAGSVSDRLARRLRASWEPLPASGGERTTLIAVQGRHGVVGVLAVLPVDQRGVDEDLLVVLRLCTRRVGTMLENSWLYEREHQLAETMQRAMLPQQAEIDGLDVWTYYAPNEHDAQIGGDWYDVLPIDGDVAGVVIGDVVGHDVEAAATMGQLRSVVRAYAFGRTEPAAVLDQVDRLVAGMGVSRAAALVYTTLTRHDDHWRLDYTRAGHLPLLLIRGGGARFLDGALGPLVGFGGTHRTADSADLVPGDVLVYFTDGLVERRDRALRDGLDVLALAATAVRAGDAAGIGEELLAQLVQSSEDDIAMVVLRVPRPDEDLLTRSSPRRRRWTLPSEAASIRLARRSVARTCAAWDLPTAQSAELVVSELVANAVMHGWGHVSLQLYDTADGLRIEVEDANHAPPVTSDGHPGRVGGYGMKIVEQLADWGWRPTPGGKVVWAKVHPDAPIR